MASQPAFIRANLADPSKRLAANLLREPAESGARGTRLGR
jgi:hypothetical protein